MKEDKIRGSICTGILNLAWTWRWSKYFILIVGSCFSRHLYTIIISTSKGIEIYKDNKNEV